MDKKVEKNDRNNVENFTYDKGMVILDEITEDVIEALKEASKGGDYSSDKVVNLSRVLKYVTSAKKNILKSDLLAVELDDALYDDFEDDGETEEFEEEDVEDETPDTNDKASDSKSKK